ncbi:MAG: hypothetical protein V4747_06950, partial [Pseudomonadota bacterium]
GGQIWAPIGGQFCVPIDMLDAFAPIAHQQDLLGTFSIMLASSVLLVPLERAKVAHPLKQEQGGNLQSALDSLARQRWLEAEFWKGNATGDWRFSRIMGKPDNTHAWLNKAGQQSFSPEANTIGKRKLGEVLYVLRNALAHGNIIYLDEKGHEEKGNRVEHLAFLSRCEPQEDEANTYQLVTVREKDFLPFIKAWAQWIAAHNIQHIDDRVT